MSFFKFLFYVVVAYLVIRYLNKLFSPKPKYRDNTDDYNPQNRSKNTDRPKFNIEADTVDYEIIEEKKDEK